MAFPAPPAPQNKVLLWAESGHLLPWGWSPAPVLLSLDEEQSLSPQQERVWTNSLPRSRCSRTPSSLLVETQGCAELASPTVP